MNRSYLEMCKLAFQTLDLVIPYSCMGQTVMII
jgi:hypothetical protein